MWESRSVKIWEEDRRKLKLFELWYVWERELWEKFIYFIILTNLNIKKSSTYKYLIIIFNNLNNHVSFKFRVYLDRQTTSCVWRDLHFFGENINKNFASVSKQMTFQNMKFSLYANTFPFFYIYASSF